MSSTTSIHAAQPKDLSKVIALGSRSLGEGPYREMLADRPDVTLALAQKLIEMPNARILVAETDQGIVGVFAFVIFPHYYSGEMVAGELIWYLIPEERHGGQSLQLLWAAESLAKKLGAVKMQLTAPTDEIAAMYGKLHGFVKVETSFQRDLTRRSG